MSAYALWRRALDRVGRRARTYLESRDSGCAGPGMARDDQLLREATRLANRLAPGPRFGR